MTNSKELVARLHEEFCSCVNEPEYKPIKCYVCEAANIIEAQAAEIERLKRLAHPLVDGSISDSVIGGARAFLDELRDHFEGQVDVNAEDGPNFAMTVMAHCDVVAEVINRLMRSRNLARDQREAAEAEVAKLKEALAAARHELVTTASSVYQAMLKAAQGGADE